MADDHYHGVLHELKEPYQELRGPIGEVIAAYSGLHRSAMADGALPIKVKELIALAIAITRECDGCIASHARTAVRRGVTSREVAETIGVAIMMNGGPGTVWGPWAWAAYQEFAATDSTIPPEPAGPAESASTGTPAGANDEEPPPW